MRQQLGRQYLLKLQDGSIYDIEMGCKMVRAMVLMRKMKKLPRKVSSLMEEEKGKDQ